MRSIARRSVHRTGATELFLLRYSFLMSTNVLSLEQAAHQLGVSRRRVDAMVLGGRLSAQRVGRQWVVSPEAVRRAAGLRSVGGRPVGPKRAWALIEGLPDGVVGGRSGLDRLRRKVRPRADHAMVYVHPGAMARLLGGGVLGGLDAAAAIGAPVDVGTVHDVYLKASRASELLKAVGARPTEDGANVYVHVVDDEAWPFTEGHRAAAPWVGWLDLADREDRAADAVLDRLVGGRLRA